MGKIISHYLFKETATTWLAVTVILLIILWNNIKVKVSTEIK